MTPINGLRASFTPWHKSCASFFDLLDEGTITVARCRKCHKKLSELAAKGEVSYDGDPNWSLEQEDD